MASTTIVLPTTSWGALQRYLREDKSAVYNYMITKIEEAVDSKENRVVFFKFAGTDYILATKKEHYVEIINQALQYFAEHEFYEVAARCRDLIFKIKIEDVIAPG